MPELDELIFRFQNGESDLREPIRVLLYEKVDRFFKQQRIPRSDAPDIVAQFFNDLFDRKLRSYRVVPEAEFSNWLYRVVVNAANDWKKKQARNRETAASDYIELSDAFNKMRDWQQEQARISERGYVDDICWTVMPSAWRTSPSSRRMAPVVAALQAAFDTLDSGEKDLILQRVVLGMEYREIAVELGILRTEHLRVQFSRAQDKIWNFMKADGRVPREFFEPQSKGRARTIKSRRDNEQSAELGLYGIQLLRHQRARYGYIVRPVSEYLADLARQARINIAMVLESFGLQPQTEVDRRTAEKIADVLHRIGCPAAQAFQMLRMSFAESHGFSVTTELAVSYRGGTGAEDMEFCEQALRHAESRYGADLWAELEEVRAAAERRYARGL